MRALGLDLGTRRVGVAICDSAGRVATPVTTLIRSHSGGLAELVDALVRERDAEIVVVGLPRSLTGKEGPAAAAARSEIRWLDRSLNVPVIVWDERFTTKIAEHSLYAQGLKGKKRRRVVDQLAASVILQSWLDAGMPRVS